MDQEAITILAQAVETEDILFSPDLVRNPCLVEVMAWLPAASNVEVWSTLVLLRFLDRGWQFTDSGREVSNNQSCHLAG